MQGYRLNSNELSLKLMAVKMEAEPFNATYKTIFNALQLEIRHFIPQALELYKMCLDDDFAKEKVRELTSKHSGNINVSKAIKTPAIPYPPLTAEEHKLLAAIIKLKQQRIPASKKVLMAETNFKNTSLVKLMKSLEKRSYIARLNRQYKHIEILRTPISDNGQGGLLQHPKPTEPSSVSAIAAPLQSSFPVKPLVYMSKRDPIEIKPNNQKSEDTQETSLVKKQQQLSP